MPAVRAMTIAVGELYAYTLSIALPKNMRHFTEALVVTAIGDEAVKSVALSVPSVRVLETDAFTRPGVNGVVPRFNKGLAAEAGFDELGREGWLAVVDADIILPAAIPFDQLQVGYLFGMRRRILQDPRRYHPGLDWRNCPVHRDGGPVGFFQAFSCEDVVIKGGRPWYDVSFPHAGGGDARFMRHWPRSRWRILPCDALHLGPVDAHWFGTDQEGRDLMAKFVRDNGWRRAMHLHSDEAARRAGEIPGRVEVPGYEMSTFDLPFVQRARGETPEH